MATKRFKALAHSEKADALRDEYRKAYKLYVRADRDLAAAETDERDARKAERDAFDALRAAVEAAGREAADAERAAYKAAGATREERSARRVDAERLCEGLRYRARRLCAAALGQLLRDNAEWLGGQGADYKAVRAFFNACEEFAGDGAQLSAYGPRYSLDVPHAKAGVCKPRRGCYDSDAIRIDLASRGAHIDVDAAPSMPDAGDVPTAAAVRRAVSRARTAEAEARKAVAAYAAACKAREAALWPLRSVVEQVRSIESIQL